jgi:DNA polymerase-1
VSKRLIVVDISSFIFRAFFAIRPMHTPEGTPVNAVYGTLSMLLKLMNAYQPSHIILARDTAGGSFRNERYELYKANRSEPPEELIPQFGLIEELIEKMKIPHKAMANYEADDVIGSIVTQFKEDFDEVLIASGDKDLMQFVDDKVKMLDTMKDKIYGRKEVHEKMGVWPEQIMDYLSLLGDSSDNIPGVKGIGAKGASKLLEEYGNLDEIIKNKENITNKRAKTALENYEDDAHLSRELVEIVQNLEMGFKAQDLKFQLEADDELLDFLESLNFKTLKNKIASGTAVTSTTPQKRVFIDYDVIKQKEKWDKMLATLSSEDQVYVEAYYTHGDYHKLDPMTLTVATGDKVYVGYCEEIGSFADMVGPILKNDDLLISAINIKPLACAAIANNIQLDHKVFDISQAHFVLNPDQKHDLQTICKEFLQENVKTLKELSKESLEQQASVTAFEEGLARRGYWALRAYPWLMKRLEEENLHHVYYDMDLKLIPILASMEMEGIRLDTQYFQELETEFQKITDDIILRINDAAGEEINLRSPKQLSVLLFEKLELPVIKKTKTGYSTDSSVLEELARQGESEIPAMILQFREVDKLLSTYVKALPKLVNGDSKIHTHFMQNVAATGRLSSENPNLQNIPIRTENGRRLRKGFVARDGHVLLGADYSQVELRILAHCSGDEVMVDAFKNDEDIHAQTASEVFSTPLVQVSKNQRSYAKAINFGLMYGQSSFGLAQTLNISRKEAKDYITRYFTRFSKVKSYLDGLKEECEKTGYSITEMGRKRIIKDINSSNRQMKSMAERMAINSPIQGTAADIIKKAMIVIEAEMKRQKLKSLMLLQVHDELIFEVPEEEVELMQNLVREKMENVVNLNVPLKIDMGTAKNWYDLK